ncbi:MAG TPA: SCO family protein [Kofleriaceae bacterium]|nr:SCO family protein [Kofleriaceae bacterium]
MRLAIALLAAACSGHPAPPRAAPAPAPPARAPVATGPSLYDLALPLTRASGDVVGLDVDRGHPTLISMFYGSCSVACPVLVDKIAGALAQLPDADRRDARVLLVSFDPARDTPARLRELANEHRLDARWTLAAASDGDARTLAAVLGIRYRAAPGGQFFHTAAVVALDRDGRIVARMDGLGDPASLVDALQQR